MIATTFISIVMQLIIFSIFQPLDSFVEFIFKADTRAINMPFSNN